jgi:hypothetical protein
MTAQTTSWHWAARGSIFAALGCFTGNCLVNRLVLVGELGEVSWLSTGVSVFTSGLVLLGLVLGGVGLFGGWRRGASDTIGVAVIGILLNLGIVALTIWALWVLRDVAR